jgi:DNA-binding NtrC family response regulator
MLQTRAPGSGFSDGSDGSDGTRSRSLILVASSTPSTWKRVKEALEGRFAVSYSVDLGGTLDVVQRHRPALVVVCPQLLDATVDELLPHLREHAPDTPCIAITSSGPGGTPQLLADACLPEHRVAGSLSKVVHELLDHHVSAGPARERVRGRLETPRPRVGALALDVGTPSALSELPEYREMVIGDNPRVQAIVEDARRVAPVDVNVLITGESGTGKEVLARYIHCLSGRARGPFEPVDLPSIPSDLFESILFGHERGSFTGAVAQSEGKFLRARRGTLFLDEISSLRLDLQPKLLRVIQEKNVECVGGRGRIPCDVRIIAATNVDLEEAVRRGAFRSDLFYRLSVITLDLVPLRQRREDIPALLDFFLERYAREYARELPGLSTSALDALQGHDWPGNIRELENRAQRALLLCRSGRLEAGDFFRELRGPASGERPASLDAEAGAFSFGDCDHSIAEVEQAYINRVMEKTEGNQSRAAQILQISRKTLRSKLQLYAADKPLLRSLPAS